MKHIIIILLFLIIIATGNAGKLMAQEQETDITHILDKGQFEAIVKYVLDKGKIWEFYSTLWGSSPCFDAKNFYITLIPNGPYLIPEYKEKINNNVSHYKAMDIGHFHGLANARIVLREDKVYITSIINGIPEYNELLNILMKNIIPQIKKLVKI